MYYEESQQQVTLLRGAEDKGDLDVMSADEVSPAVWSLSLCTKDNKCSGEALQAQPSTPGSPDNSSWRKIVFTDYSVAIRLEHWLRTHPTETPHAEIGGYKFNFPTGFDGTKYSGFRPTKTTDNNCEKKAPVEASSVPKAGTPAAEIYKKSFCQKPGNDWPMNKWRAGKDLPAAPQLSHGAVRAPSMASPCVDLLREFIRKA